MSTYTSKGITIYISLQVKDNLRMSVTYLVIRRLTYGMNKLGGNCLVNKHKNVKLLTSAAVLTSAIVAPVVVSAAPTYFKDVSSSHVAYDAIMDLSGKGIINGYADGTFRPSAKVTRGQAAKILATSLNLDINNVRNPHFRDVPPTHGFYKYVAALHDAGIIDGYSNGNFRSG